MPLKIHTNRKYDSVGHFLSSDTVGSSEAKADIFAIEHSHGIDNYAIRNGGSQSRLNGSKQDCATRSCDDATRVGVECARRSQNGAGMVRQSSFGLVFVVVVEAGQVSRF